MEMVVVVALNHLWRSPNRRFPMITRKMHLHASRSIYLLGLV